MWMWMQSTSTVEVHRDIVSVTVVMSRASSICRSFCFFPLIHKHNMAVGHLLYFNGAVRIYVNYETMQYKNYDGTSHGHQQE